MNLKSCLYLLTLVFCSPAVAQLTEPEEELLFPSVSADEVKEWSVDINLRGLGSTQERLPFWLYSNQRGRVSQDSNFSSWISGRTVQYLTRNSYFFAGAGILYHDGINDGLKIDEAYLHYQNPYLYATLGRKQRPELYNGLSSSNESILWSLNARPMPGIQLGTARPIFPFSDLDEGLGFEATWDEYWMGNDREVQGAKLHHKNFRFVYKRGTWQAKAGLNHFVQWGGVSPSPRYGQQPERFEDYLRIVFGQEGTVNASEGDQLNALGNHVGGYELYLSKEFRDFSIEIFYNHLFEDGSGRRLGNTPDGRYGIFYENKEKEKIINSIMYEWVTTEHQSHTTTGEHKYDNYFNHGIYGSGWTYENRVIGVPFFTADPNSTQIIINNKFSAHHLGIGGEFGNYFNTFPYRLLLTYAHNDGVYTRRFRPKQDVFYGLYDVKLYDVYGLQINAQLGLELNSYTAPVYGGGVHVRYRL